MPYKPTGVNKQELDDLERIVKRRDDKTLEAIHHLKMARLLLDEDYAIYSQVQGFLDYCLMNLKEFITDKKRLKE